MYLIFFYVNINIGDCMLVRLGYVAISTAIDVTSYLVLILIVSI